MWMLGVKRNVKALKSSSSKAYRSHRNTNLTINFGSSSFVLSRCVVKEKCNLVPKMAKTRLDEVTSRHGVTTSGSRNQSRSHARKLRLAFEHVIFIVFLSFLL